MKMLMAAVLFAFASGVLFAWFITEPVNSEKNSDLNTITSLGVTPLSDIQLTDHDNQLLSLKSFVGKTVVLNFMFNGCSPVQTVGLRRVFLDHQLDTADKNIRFLSISVAPETDTPEQLNSFAKRYGIDAENWRLGITDRSSLDRLLQVFNAGQAVTDDPNAHLNTVFLINPAGQMQKVYTGFPISPDVVYADLADLIKSKTTHP